MLKSSLIALWATLCLAACSHTPTASPDTRAKLAAATTPAHCLTTGTHLHLEPGQCASERGRAYSQDDIESTGAVDAADALRRLDPSIY